MTDLGVQPAAAVTPGLSQWQRVTNIFTAPSKTFEDIKRGNKSWWMPFLIMVVFGYILFAAITIKVGWTQVAENTVRADAKTQERFSNMQADQRQTAMKFTAYSMEGGFGAAPVIVLLFSAIGSLLLWPTINFVFGGKASFGSVFAAWMFAGLPGIFKSILGAIVLYAGAAPESFNIANFAPTSVGAFLNQQETNAAVYKLATAIDITTIWCMVLMGMGLAIVAGVKRSSGYMAVFGWYALVVILQVGWAAAFS
jgi:Yip1 domain